MSDIKIMSQDEMSERVARFADQRGNTQLMITQSIPGFQRDIYSFIGGADLGYGEVNINPAFGN